MDPTYFDYEGQRWAARALPDGRLIYRRADKWGEWDTVDDTTDPEFVSAIRGAVSCSK